MSRTSKPRLLDLFCGAGGASLGYVLAGFEVAGVDIDPQPHYLRSGAAAFVQDDWLSYVTALGKGFDVIHASPPAGASTVYRNSRRDDVVDPYEDLIAEVREALAATGNLYVIQSVAGAPLHGNAVM